MALGLLSALFLIIASNVVFKEGLTIGDDTASSTNATNDKVIVTTKLKSDPNTKLNTKKTERTISDLKAQAETTGVDRQSIEESIKPKSSKTISIDKTNFESTEVNPSDPTTKSGIEGFSYYNSYKQGYRNI